MLGLTSLEGWISSSLLLFVSVFLFAWLLRAVVRRNVLVHMIDRFPGPAAWPVIGNLKGLKLDTDKIFYHTTGVLNLWTDKNVGATRIWAAWNPLIFLSTPSAIEPVATSNINLSKSREYNTLKAWLGSGLVTVEGDSQWFSRRRLLTPAFHFSILEDFVSVMNEQCGTLVKLLNEKANGKSFNLYPYLNRCALDIICGSAMGCSINAQLIHNSEYNKAIESMSYVIQSKFHRPWLQFEPFFKMSQLYRKQNKALSVLKGFTRKVIEERRDELQSRTLQSAGNYTGKKKRLAFLDLILTTKTTDGRGLTNDEIQEEVDTFMFAGHDTITAGMAWCLFLLGLNPDKQDKCYEELQRVFGDSYRDVTLNDLRNLKYLECCLKEAQRIYPSVPYWGRKLKEPIHISGHCVPSGTTVMSATYVLHRNPDIWNDPEIFQPDRFLTENTTGRHPYAFLPFSAGPRNCIGQRFAIAEEKVILATLLRHFKFESLDRRDTMTVINQLILKPKDGITMRITHRK